MSGTDIKYIINDKCYVINVFWRVQFRSIQVLLPPKQTNLYDITVKNDK